MSKSKDDLNVKIDDAVERLGMGMFQTRLLFASGLCFAADAMEVLLLSFLAIVVKEEWNLSEDAASSITSSVFAGALTGTLILGPLGDVWGRRPVFVLTAIIISVFGLATGAVNGFAALIGVRFCVGFGVGGLLVPFDTLAEFIPTSHRGSQLLVISYFWAFGTMLVPVFAYFTLGQPSTGDGVAPWRIFVLLCALPCIISIILAIVFVPESPRFLVTKGQNEKALDILRAAAAQNNKDPMLLFPQGTVLVDDSPEEVRNSVFDLLSKQWLKITISLWFVWASFALLYYGAIITITMVFAKTGGEGNTGNNNEVALQGDGTVKFDYVAIFLSAFSEVVGITMVIFTVDRFGRVPTQTITYLMAGICIMTLCFCANANAPRAVLVLFAFLTRMFASCASSVTWVSTPEILTTEIRTTGHSVCNAIARAGGAAAPFLASNSTPFPVIGISFLVVSFVAAISSSFLPETAGMALGLMHHTHDKPKNADEAVELENQTKSSIV